MKTRAAFKMQDWKQLMADDPNQNETQRSQLQKQKVLFQQQRFYDEPGKGTGS
jgi:hypothetical protein